MGFRLLLLIRKEATQHEKRITGTRCKGWTFLHLKYGGVPTKIERTCLTLGHYLMKAFGIAFVVEAADEVFFVHT
jgi:hypothetical protein